jgi:hypothetical protein
MFPPKEFSTSFIVTSFPSIRLQDKIFLDDIDFNLQEIAFSEELKCVYDTLWLGLCGGGLTVVRFVWGWADSG